MKEWFENSTLHTGHNLICVEIVLPLRTIMWSMFLCRIWMEVLPNQLAYHHAPLDGYFYFFS